MSNPKPPGGNPTSAKYGRKYECRCLADYIGCGKMDYKISDCPSVSKNEEDNR